MLKALLIGALLFMLMGGLETGVIFSLTRDSGALSQKEIDLINSHTPAPPEGGADPNQAPAVASPSEMDRVLEECQVALIQWTVISMVAGFIATVAWLFEANAQDKRLTNADDAKSARPMWFAGLIAFLVVAGLAALAELGFAGIGTKLSVQVQATMAVSIVILGALGYYMSTLIGVPSLVRTSVPLAGSLRR